MLNTTNTTPSPNNWPAREIFDPTLTHKTISCSATGAQTITEHSSGTHLSRPIYYMPAIALDANFKPLVMFGTGYIDDYISETGSTVQNYFYVTRLERTAYTGIASSNEYITELVFTALTPGER